MRIGIVGIRGLPNRYGGFEQFVEVLVKSDVFQSDDEFYVFAGDIEEPNYSKNVTLIEIGVSKSKNPLLYYMNGVTKASRTCDVILSCGVGASIFTAIPRILGKKIFTNIDGLEWRRTKWPIGYRIAIWLFYFPAFIFSTTIVVDAQSLVKYVPRIFRNKTTYIPYQAPEISLPNTDFGSQFPSQFSLCICRLEPENFVKEIIVGHLESSAKIPLLVVGSTDSTYFKSHLSQFQDRVTFLGGIYNLDKLNFLRRKCSVYYHGHSVGGTNPSLLEAMVHVQGLLICHDNEFNREVTSNLAHYFQDSKSLSDLINSEKYSKSAKPTFPLKRYSSPTISRRYKNLFYSL